MTRRVAVIGGGWAGCAAALTLAQAGCRVSVFEAADRLGGRARTVTLDDRELDNGQHILSGAYTQTLDLIARVGVDSAALLRLPFALDCPGEFTVRCPRLPAPWHLVAGLAAARGFSVREKAAALRWAGKALGGAPPAGRQTAAEWLAGQPQRLRERLWEPLCIAALNTPPARASAASLHAVLVASLSGRRANSDLILPRVNLGALFPAPAARRIAELGGSVHLRTRVRALTAARDGVTVVTATAAMPFDHAIIAVAPQHLKPLVRAIAALDATVATVGALAFEPIATAYLQYPPGTRLDRPMLALAGQPAQFVFDRGQTHGQDGLFAAVASAASALIGQSRTAWLDAIERQLTRVARLPRPSWRRGVIEKQATWSCRPGIVRPGTRTAHARVFLAGDYLHGAYPATLESATLAGVQSAQALLEAS
jgi:squalene-associated FAD-dependent desaturase